MVAAAPVASAGRGRLAGANPVGLIDPERDSLRFYRLSAEGRRRVEHVGTKPTLDLDGPPVF